jgi:ketosteroid isomerase-like protein
MSEENVEVVRRVYDAVARGDSASVLAAYDPECEMDFTRSPLLLVLKQQVYRGYEGLRSCFRERREEAWGAIEDVCEELIDAGGEQVISVVSTRGSGRVSGAPVALRHAGVWTVRNGKVVRVAWVGSRDEALEVAGLAEPAVSQENLEVVRQLALAVRRRDLSQLLRLTDPQVEWRSFLSALAEGGLYRGHEGLRQYLSDLDDAFETFSTDVDGLLGVGALVVGVGHIQYRGKGSGVETEASVGWVFKLRDGKVLRVRAFREPEKALEAAGLSE